VYTHKCSHANIPTYQHTHMHTLQTYIHACIRAQKHMCDECICILPCPTSTTSSCYSYFRLVGLCICVSMHMHMYVHTCTHAYPLTHERACMMHTHITQKHACIHTTHAHILTWIHPSIHLCVCVCVCVCVRTRLCVRVCGYIKSGT